MYKIIKHESNDEINIMRELDSAAIPKDENNKDYAEYLKWVKAGNVALIEIIKIGYAQKRLNEYPPFEDILEALIESTTNKSKRLRDIEELRAAIKLKYPKP